MSFDVQAECPSFFENEIQPLTPDNVNGTNLTNTAHQISASMTEAKEDHLENIEDRQPKLSMRNGDSLNSSTQVNQHYAQSFVKNNIKGKPMFSLHRHVKADTIPCLAFDSLALETTFRMMKINFNVRYDVKKLNKPAYINHEGYLLTGIKKVIHYLNLRSKRGIDGHLSVIDNSTVRAFTTMLIDQTNFIVDFYRYQQNFEGWKDVVRDSNHTTSKENALKIIKNKKKSHKFIKERMYGLGFYNWCEEGIKSVAKEDFKNLSQLLSEKKFFMGDIPCVLDCIAFAIISNIISSNHTNPLVTIIRNDCPNLVIHCERVKELFWPDWIDQIIAKPSTQQQSSSTRPKSFSYKRLSFRNRRSKSTSVRSANTTAISTTTTNNKDLKALTSASNTAATRSPHGSNTIELTTKEDIPSENNQNSPASAATTTNPFNGQIDDELLQKPTTITTVPIDDTPSEPIIAKPIRSSFYKNLATKCNFFRRSKGKPSSAPVTNDTSPRQPSSNTCMCGSNKNSAVVTSSPEIAQTIDKENNSKNVIGDSMERAIGDEDFTDALDDDTATAEKRVGVHP